MRNKIDAVTAHTRSIYVEAVSVLLCISRKMDDLEAIGRQLDMTTDRLDKLLVLLADWKLVKIPELPGKLSLMPKGKNIVNYHKRDIDKSLDHKRRIDAKNKNLRSIRMMPREWLKII